MGGSDILINPGSDSCSCFLMLFTYKFVLLQPGSIKRACNSKSHDNTDATDTH